MSTSSSDAGPCLWMIPCSISDADVDLFFSARWREEIKHIRHFIVEDVRSARRFLGALKIFDVSSLVFEELNVHTPQDSLPGLLKPLTQGVPVGILSESGCPGIADPGARAVAWAHDHGIPVRALTGPSSIVLALMASGMNGQRFTFHGYLPVEPEVCSNELKKLERESAANHTTHIFIENPHRNKRLLETMIRVLSANTRLAIALDLTGPSEKVISLPVRHWKSRPAETLPKLPCIFLFQA